MATLMNAGRIELAKGLKQTIEADPTSALIAVGNGDPWWGAQQLEVLTVGVDRKFVPTKPLKLTNPIVIKSEDGQTTYAGEADYLIVNGAFLSTENGAIAAEQKVQVSYTADKVLHDVTETSLKSEVGRCKVSGVDYVQRVIEGNETETDIPFGGVSYQITANPTRLLLMRARLNATDAVGDDIREYGLFTGCEIDETLPAGTTFFDVAEVTNPGSLLLANAIASVPHNGAIGLDISVILEI